MALSPCEYEELTDVSSQITVKNTGASVKAYKSGRVVFLSYTGNAQGYTAGQLYEILDLPSNLCPKTDFNTIGIGTTNNTSVFAVYFDASVSKVKILTSDTTSRRCTFGCSYIV
jgi:hypothetical protein